MLRYTAQIASSFTYGKLRFYLSRKPCLKEFFLPQTVLFDRAGGFISCFQL